MSSQNQKEPVGPWEQQRSSPGSPESQGQDVAPPQDEDDPMGEEVADLWIAEDEEDYVARQATHSSISASNPWVLYEAGIVCARDEHGQLRVNSRGEKIITIREWAYFLTNQKIALRRQPIGRADWETLPWTGHMCYLITLSWEMGRLRSFYLRKGQYNKIDDFLMECRLNGTDWMGGTGEPPGWANRFEIGRDQWSENWLLYQRDLQIQNDMDWLVEAVYQFYQVHLDRLIRCNDRLRGDFCVKKVDGQGQPEGLLLNTFGYDTLNPDVEVPMDKDTTLPDPGYHFSFSTNLMVLALEQYQRFSPRDLCHYVRKLVQFVESRKEMTAQPYGFFVEHAYNQFFQHEAPVCTCKNKGKGSWRRQFSHIGQA